MRLINPLLSHKTGNSKVGTETVYYFSELSCFITANIYFNN